MLQGIIFVIRYIKKDYMCMCYMELYSLFSMQILIAGDKKGNIAAFPFRKTLTAHESSGAQQKIPLCDRFKGAHGISSVTSVHITTSTSDQIEIHTVCPDCFVVPFIEVMSLS